jgi:hypothetical protein
LKEVENKFLKELEITRVLSRLRNSELFIKSMLKRDHKELLSYSRDRVIDFEEDHESDEESLSESSDEHKFKHNVSI